MSKKLFLLFIFALLFTGSRCFAAASSLQDYIIYYFNITIALAGVLAVIILATSGIQFIYSAGNPEKTNEAKKRAISAILGLIILLSSFLIIQTINPKLKNLDPTEQLRVIGAFRFVGGRDGASTGAKSGCGINECLGLNGTCSWDNCGGYDYTGCKYGECLEEGQTQENDPDGESCSSDNCVSTISGCRSNQCLGLDGSCAWYNCNWGIQKPAPLSLENTDGPKEKYSKIVWDPISTDLLGRQVNNCDPDNPNAIYVLYLYKDYNFKNLYKLARMKCDGNRQDISEAKSYMLIKEVPGVYFYGENNCYPSGDSPPALHSQSIPEGWPEEIKSVRIVNGPDPKKGPFFGLIYFNDSDYKTDAKNPRFKHFVANTNRPPPDNYSTCISWNNNNFVAKNGSWVVYSWVGFKENGQTIAKAGDGVTLHSRTSWLGGSYQVRETQNWPWQLDLQNTPISYSSNSGVPIEEQNLCSYFYPDKSCLKSFEIKGDYLVLVSSVPDRPWIDEPTDITINGHAQAFPISSRLQEVYKNREGYSVEKGTPELALDYIGWLKSANFMEIIPLAEKSN